MTPKDLKDIKRAIFIDTAIALAAFGAVGLLVWDRFRPSPPEPTPSCLAPEHPFDGSTSHAWFIESAGDQIWVCGPDADRKTFHCMRMIERSGGECIQWAKEFNAKSESRQK
jgi:hypothetical protein